MPLRDWPQHIRDRFVRGAEYRTVFGTPAGGRVLADLTRFCLMDADIHVPGDALETAHNTGRRRVALRIYGFMHFTEAEAQRLAQRADQGFAQEADQ